MWAWLIPIAALVLLHLGARALRKDLDDLDRFGQHIHKENPR